MTENPAAKDRSVIYKNGSRSNIRFSASPALSSGDGLICPGPAAPEKRSGGCAGAAGLRFLALVAVSGALLLAGCSTPAGEAAQTAYSFYNANYDRSLSISTGVDGKPSVNYTITPKAAPAQLTDAQIADLLAHFAAYAEKDGKAVKPLERAQR